ALENVPITRGMRSAFTTLPPSMTVEQFVHDHALASDQQAFPIQVDDALLGTVGVEQIRNVATEAWPTTTIEQIMVPRAQLPTLPPGAGAARALVELARSDVNRLAVIDGRKLLGLVRREDLVRWLDIHEWMTAAEG